MKRRIDLRRYFPPGMKLSGYIQFFVTAYLCSGLYAALFFIPFGDAISNLYDYTSEGRVLREDAVMRNFTVILGNSYIGYLIIAVFSLMMIFSTYLYYRQGGSKSIYLMRRIPSASELHIRCLTIPLAMFAISIASAFLCIVILYAIYMIFTPSQCIVPGQWQMLWSKIL